MTGCAEKSALLLFVTMKSNNCDDSSAGPFESAVAQGLTVCAPASSLTVWSAPLVNEGTSFTELTVIVAVALPALNPAPTLLVAACTVKLKVFPAGVFKLAAGVNFNPAFP